MLVPWSKLLIQEVQVVYVFSFGTTKAYDSRILWQIESHWICLQIGYREPLIASSLSCCAISCIKRDAGYNFSCPVQHSRVGSGSVESFCWLHDLHWSRWLTLHIDKYHCTRDYSVHTRHPKHSNIQQVRYSRCTTFTFYVWMFSKKYKFAIRMLFCGIWVLQTKRCVRWIPNDASAINVGNVYNDAEISGWQVLLNYLFVHLKLQTVSLLSVWNKTRAPFRCHLYKGKYLECRLVNSLDYWSLAYRLSRQVKSLKHHLSISSSDYSNYRCEVRTSHAINEQSFVQCTNL